MRTILIIEDNDDIRESTSEILALAGYRVLKAENGKIGAATAQKELPDLILCDIMMPELDGYGVLYLLSKNPKTAVIPFIFLTAKAERIDMRKGMEMGADDYLTKPFDDMELLNAIESRFNKKEQQQAFYSRSLESLNQLAGQHGGIEALKKAVSERKARQIKKKQVIYYEGDPASGIYLILSGQVKSVKLNPDGRELLTAIHGPEEYLGIHALLSGDLYTETVEALDDSTLCFIPRETIEDILNKYTDAGRQFIKILASSLKEKEEQLLELAYNSVRKRMAQTLLKLLSQHPDGTSGSLRVSREDLASMAGMATETVSRTLSDFKDEGIIGKKGSQIDILNIEKLQRMKN